MPIPAQMPQQQFNPAPILFNNPIPQQQPNAYIQPQLLPQQNIQNLLLSLAGQGLLNPLLAVAQQTQQQMATNPLLNLVPQPQNLPQVQQSYSHQQGGRGGYHNPHYNAPNQYSQGRGGYNPNFDRGRGGFDRGRGGQRGGPSRGGGGGPPSRGHYSRGGGNRGSYNRN